VVRDEIVIVEPRDEVIVAVLPVGSSGAALESGGAAPAQVGELGLSSDEIIQVQIMLNQLGFDIGEPDGVLGPRTREALMTFQERHSLQATGRIDNRTMAALRSAAPVTTTGQGGGQQER
jgi:peptidoglycan hydrolase-like protein with peptidoglycan-binding domain